MARCVSLCNALAVDRKCPVHGVTDLECMGCGNPFTPGADNEGCQPCALCVTCTPAACVCREGKQLRRDDDATAEWDRFRKVVGL